MKIVSGMKLFSILLGTTATTTLVWAKAPTPVSNVQVSLKGKKYQIDDVTTMTELQERLEEQSGIPPSKQGKILHNGKRLSLENALSDAGVLSGDQLNCVPSKKASSKKKSTPTTSTSSSTAEQTTTTTPPSPAGLEEMMKGLGLGRNENNAAAGGGLDDMLSKMMSSSSSGGMPDMAESMKMMKELTNSPLFSEYMNDPEKLEESRQMILQNPMMKSMMASMPGMSEILEDKDAWAQAMMAAAGIMKSMDPEDMMKMMELQQQQQQPGGGGLFDGGSSGALDELSEDE